MKIHKKTILAPPPSALEVAMQESPVVYVERLDTHSGFINIHPSPAKSDLGYFRMGGSRPEEGLPQHISKIEFDSAEEESLLGGLGSSTLGLLESLANGRPIVAWPGSSVSP